MEESWTAILDPSGVWNYVVVQCWKAIHGPPYKPSTYLPQLWELPVSLTVRTSLSRPTSASLETKHLNKNLLQQQRKQALSQPARGQWPDCKTALGMVKDGMEVSASAA